MHKDIETILFTEEQIKERVRQLGAEITKDYEGKPILLVGILKGAVTFYTDLARSIEGPVEFDSWFVPAMALRRRHRALSKSERMLIPM